MITTDEFMLGASLLALAGLGVAIVAGERIGKRQQRKGHPWTSTDDPTPRPAHYKPPPALEPQDERWAAHRATARSSEELLVQTMRDRMFPPSLQHYWVPNGERPGPDGRWWVFLGATRTIWGFDNAAAAMEQADRQNQVEKRGKYHPGYVQRVMVADEPPWDDQRALAADVHRAGPTYDGKMHRLRMDHVALVPEGTPGATGYIDHFEGVTDAPETYQWRNMVKRTPALSVRQDMDPCAYPECGCDLDAVCHAAVIDGPPLVIGMDLASGPDFNGDSVAECYCGGIGETAETIGHRQGCPEDAERQRVEVLPLQEVPGAHYEAIVHDGGGFRVALTAVGRPAMIMGMHYHRLRDARGAATKLNKAEGRISAPPPQTKPGAPIEDGGWYHEGYGEIYAASLFYGREDGRDRLVRTYKRPRDARAAAKRLNAKNNRIRPAPFVRRTRSA